jgi:hypothetical protein
MKVRVSFVSNSSSASFVIFKSRISPKQERALQDFETSARQFLDDLGESATYRSYSGWEIKETPEAFEGNTVMDNLDIEEFLYHLGINNAKISEGFWDLGDDDEEE